MTLEIRPVRAEEWRELRDIRLRALADAPDAFGSSFAREEQFPDGEWIRRAERGARGGDARTFLAVDGDGFCGLIAVFLEEAAAELVSLWVDPTYRNRGLGFELIRVVEQWASEAGADTVELWVTHTNKPARRLYERAGYSETGQRQPHPWNPKLEEIQLRKILAGR